MLTIDGAQGEGGGQILRSSLALSVCLGRPFHMFDIRKARRRPGLMRQHLAAVYAAAEISQASVEGAELESRELHFAPGPVAPGSYRFPIGTAGSTSLVLQTVLPALLTARAPSRLVLEGGTHNPLAPPYDFLALSFLPLINGMGPRVTARLERPGFYPAGGGLVEVDIEPVQRLRPLFLERRGEVLEVRAEAVLANLPEHIGQRELAVAATGLGLAADKLRLRYEDARGPGNLVSVIVHSEAVTEVFTGFGERGVRAETVAETPVRQARRYLAAGVPVGDHLADQLVLPMVLAGEGSFVTLKPTLHTQTNLLVIEQFTGRRMGMEQLGEDAWRVGFSGGG